MPSLTRRRSDDIHRESWAVYYGDVCVGTIGKRAGVPVDVINGAGRAASILASIRGQHQYGSAEDFEAARAGFEDL